MAILEMLNTPPSDEQMIREIIFIFIFGFAPVWVIWSKRELVRIQLLDSLNAITTAALYTMFVLSPLQTFFGFEGMPPLLIFGILMTLIFVYLSNSEPTVNNFLQNDSAVEFPEMQFEEVTQ